MISRHLKTKNKKLQNKGSERERESKWRGSDWWGNMFSSCITFYIHWLNTIKWPSLMERISPKTHLIFMFALISILWLYIFDLFWFCVCFCFCFCFLLLFILILSKNTPRHTAAFYHISHLLKHIQMKLKIKIKVKNQNLQQNPVDQRLNWL